MANKSVFESAPKGRSVPQTDTTNRAGGSAYSVTAEAALAQLAVTGTFNETFYSGAVDQLEGIRKAADQVSPTFLAQCAIYARQKGGMKDMPAALQVMLSKADPVLSARIFHRVIDNGKMVRNLVQMVRSGAFHRKSMGSSLKRLVNGWILSRTARELFRATVGNKPSLADVIRLTRPRGSERKQKALLGYILKAAFGDPYTYEADDLPEIVQQYEAFKAGTSDVVPDVDFRQLDALPLKPEHWAEIARNGGWMFTRMNLNTFARRGVFDQEGMTQLIADRLRDREQILAARQFPYQILAAYLNTGPTRLTRWQKRAGYQEEQPDIVVPSEVRDALHDAMEIAVESVPTFGVPTAVIVDVSGSMASPITGSRQGATSKVRCIDVAALIGAAIVRKNPGSFVLPVDTRVHGTREVTHRDSIMTNARRLAAYGGGGTNLSAAMAALNTYKPAEDVQLVVMVSDCESWLDGAGKPVRSYGGGTETMAEFRKLQQRHPNAKLVCIDLQPYQTTQAPDTPDEVMNIGGFSSAMWSVIKRFVDGAASDTPEVWVSEIKNISLDDESPGV